MPTVHIHAVIIHNTGGSVPRLRPILRTGVLVLNHEPLLVLEGVPVEVVLIEAVIPGEDVHGLLVEDCGVGVPWAWGVDVDSQGFSAVVLDDIAEEVVDSVDSVEATEDVDDVLVDDCCVAVSRGGCGSFGCDSFSETFVYFIPIKIVSPNCPIISSKNIQLILMDNRYVQGSLQRS